MKKLLLFLMLLPSTLFAQGAFAPLQQATRIVNGFLVPAPLATITVCAAGATGTPCAPPLTGTVFSDLALTQPKTNPFTADANGNYIFAAVAGTYTVTVTGVNVVGYSYQVTLGGSGGGGGGPVNSVFGRTGAVVATTGDYNFGQLGSGTNTTSAMLVGSGASLAATGSGTIGATTSATATALASTPTQCGGVQFAQGIAAGGNANCATPVTANLVTGGLGVAISPNCPASGNPQCVYSPVNTQFTYDAVFNGTSTVTSATAAFTSADTGKQIAGFCSGTSEFGTSAQTVTYVNATTITASTTAAGSCSGGTLIWGNDDTAALTQASTEIAALSPPCGLISLPSGIMWDTAAQWTTITSKCEALGPGADDWLYAVYGQSRAATIIFAAPSFNFSSCTGDTLLCFGGGPNTLGKFTIWGGGWTGSPSGANGKFAVGVTFNDSNMDDVQVEQWLGPPSSATFGCMYLSGQNTQAMHPICDYTGKMELSGNMVQLWNGFSGTPNSGPSLEFSSNCVPLCKSHNGAWSGGQGTVSIQLDTSAIAVLDSDNCQGSATARACLSIGSGATAVLTNKCQMTPTGGVSAEAVYFAAANSTLSAKDCVFTGGATIGSFSSGGAGYGIINDLGGNTCTNCFLTFSGLLHNYAMEPSLGGACLNASGAGPEACGASSHGTVAIPTTTTSYVIDTIAAYAGMRVQLNYKTSNSGIPSTPTCVVPSTLGDIYVSSITAGTSFTLTLPSTTGIVCVDWSIQ